MKAQTLVLSISALFSAVQTAPAPAEKRANVVVEMEAPAAKITGKTSSKVETFNGIPFAEPPVGSLRLKPPVRLDSLADFDATGTAAACPQMFFSTESGSILTQFLGDFLTLPLLQVVNGQEDCLTINVQRPAGTTAGDSLPVLFWIFGGGFELGSTSMYDGTSLISEGIDIGKPFIFVAVNYRTGGFGFMPGKEILADGSSNLGLLDQRMGLEWVADNIASFGGDPDRVTIWGESAGAISVLDQMVLNGGDATYKGKQLFKGAIMNSGSIVPVDSVDSAKGQKVYDTVVESAGCSGSADTLACLREVDYDTFLNAANSVPGLLSYTSVALSYLPRSDGKVLEDSPDAMILAGRSTAVPMIIGDQEDEGTLFALFPSNVTSTNDIVDYLHDLYFNDASRDQIATLVGTYSASIAQGSPFRTGIFNELRPGYKRLAAILGDLVFTLTRRAFLDSHVKTNPSVPAWSYLSSYDYGTPIMGTFHGSDLLQVFNGIVPNYASHSFRNYYFNFVYNQDPNVGGNVGTAKGDYPKWEQWNTNKELLWMFNDKSETLADDFREESYKWIANNVNVLRF